MRTNHMVVTLIFIGVELTIDLRKLMDMRFQGLSSGIQDHAQAHLTTFSANGARDRGSVVGVGAPSPPIVGAPAGRVSRVEVLFTFFPPHSETSRPFQLPYPAAVSWVDASGHSLAGHAGALAQWYSGALVRQPALCWAPLSRCPAGAERPDAVSDGAAARPSRCTDCTLARIHCTDTPANRFFVSAE